MKAKIKVLTGEIISGIFPVFLVVILFFHFTPVRKMNFQFRRAFF
jgi:hypothetical protein